MRLWHIQNNLPAKNYPTKAILCFVLYYRPATRHLFAYQPYGSTIVPWFVRRLSKGFDLTLSGHDVLPAKRNISASQFVPGLSNTSSQSPGVVMREPLLFNWPRSYACKEWFIIFKIHMWLKAWKCYHLNHQVWIRKIWTALVIHCKLCQEHMLYLGPWILGLCLDHACD